MSAAVSKQNDKLNLFKCIAIYGVVFLHILLPGQIGVAANCLARMGVPLFFLSAGYFSWNSNCKVLSRRILRTARLLLGACLGLLCFGVALTLKNGGSVSEYLISRFSLYAVREFLCYQLLPLPYSWPMWFLGALLMLYLLWWALTAALGERMPHDALAVLAALLLAAHLMLGEVRFLLGGTVNSFLIRNAWLDGIPFFLLGGWMHQHKQRWQQMSTVWLRGGAVLGALLSLAERWVTDFMDLHFGTILLALCLMGLAINRPEVSSDWLRKTACFCGQSLTFYIYAFHVPIYGILKEWQSAVPAFAWLMNQGWLMPFVVAALSTLMAVLLHSLFVRKRGRGDPT